MFDAFQSRRRDLLADALVATGLAAFGARLLIATPSPTDATPALGRTMIGEARDLGILCLLLAAAIVAWAIASRRSMRSETSPRRALAPARIAAVAGATLLAAFFAQDRIRATKTDILPWPGGERYVWLDDDAMVSMRYARNLAEGRGLVWNEGERIEGYTNFLWTLGMAAPHALGVPPRLVALFPIAANCLFLAGTILVAALLAGRLRLSLAPTIAAAFAVASNRWLVHWTVGGSESVAMAFLVAPAGLSVLGATRRRPLGWGTGFALGGMALLRADGLVLAASFVPVAAYLCLRGRASAPKLLPAVVLPAAHFLFRRIYYGDWMPNTYYLKAADIAFKAPMGVHYVQYLFALFGGVCALHLVSVALARDPRERLLALPAWACIGYAAWMGGDELPEMRFLLPAVPLLLVGACAAVERIFLAPGAPARAFPARRSFALSILALGAFRATLAPNSLAELGAHRGEQERDNVRIGLILRENVAPDGLVAHFWAGAAPYFSERRGHDMLGKCDDRIARSPGKPDQWPPGHVKYDPEYSLAKEPDVVVSALPSDRVREEVRGADEARIVYPGLYALYERPEFRRDYAPGAVPLPVSREFHGIFVRAGTPRARPPGEWRDPTILQH